MLSLVSVMLGACAARSSSRDADAAVPPADATMPSGHLRIAVVADLNDAYGSTTYSAAVHTAVDRVIALHPDLVLSAGDMVAGQKPGLDYRAMWNGFHAVVTDPITHAGIPFAPTPGNHDASAYAGYEPERAIYDQEWTARKPALDFLDATHYPFRYSFAKGRVLFVSLDDTIVGKLSAEQMSWIDAQLGAHEEYPIKIVFGHVPLWAFTADAQMIGDPALEDMLRRHHVSMFLNGHTHAFYPGKRGDVLFYSMACLGSGPVALKGQTVPSPRSLLVLDVDGDHFTALDAYGGAAFDEVVDHASLPDRLVTQGNIQIDRHDPLPAARPSGGGLINLQGGSPPGR